MIRIRAFRAIDERETCEKFVEGHLKILKVFDITMVTSANTVWVSDPLTYVIVAESIETGKVLGGARVQIAGGKIVIPMEKAIYHLDNRVHDYVNRFVHDGTGELCGLWNSREIAGMGIGSVHLTRTAVCLAPQLHLKTMFAICAPYTVEMAEKVGFEVVTDLGNNGTFYYPKEDLVATGLQLFDTEQLPTADPKEREEIFTIRKNLHQVRTMQGRRGPYEILFDLEIKNTSWR